MKRLLFCCFFFCSTQLFATHIVGGEIELIRSNFPGATHQLSLNLYFDAINGNPQAEDLSVSLSVFRKRDNLFLGSAVLPKVSVNDVQYQNPNCSAVGGLKTKLIRYSDFVVLDQSTFSDAGGYYIIWERCCRNNIISNILRPEGAAMTFYLEFASLQKNNLNFVNSSPVYEPLNADYLCLNQLFKLSLAGKDAENDELVYTLQTPLNGYATSAVPNPVLATGSSNYPTVNFVPGISVLNMIPGTQPLSINKKTGEISVIPDRVGLFVFSILVEEFRNGERIGLQRRDFQLKVVDCILNKKPQILAKEDGKQLFITKDKLIEINPESNKCVNLLVTDQNINQEIKWKLLETSKDSKYLTVSNSTSIIRSSSDTLRSTLCFQDCIFEDVAKIVQVKILASDNGCPLPLTDTLVFNVRILPKKIQKPAISIAPSIAQLTVSINTKVNFNLIGFDPDGGQISLDVIGQGFDFKTIGAKIQTGLFTANFNQNFEWTPTCAELNRQKSYPIYFKISKTNCGRTLIDSVLVTINLVAPPNIQPKLEIGNSTNPIVVIVDAGVPATIEFPVTLSDQNPDQTLNLVAEGKNFILASYGMKFTNQSGLSQLKSTFSWTPTCEDYEKNKGLPIEVIFRGNDQSCSPNAVVEVSKLFVLKSPLDQILQSLPNVITPNGDDKNDYFSLENLPIGSCNAVFKEIQFLNRWGNVVYKTTESNFKWEAKNLPAGMYYYELIYTNKTYKGFVTLIN